MSILSKASLVQIPSGYGEDKLYSEVPNTTNGDFTFTRASTGTRVNSDGYIEEVPWNKAQYSQDFANAYWSKQCAINSDTQTSPIGSNDADEIVETTTNTYQYWYKQISLNVGIKQTFSVYVKYIDCQYFQLSAYNGGVYGSANFDLINKTYDTAASSGSYEVVSANLEELENDWMRVSMTFKSLSSTSSYIALCMNNNATAGYIPLYTGTGLKTAIWGLQWNSGSLKPYIKTTDRLDIPRLDYSGGASCPTLLLEGQSTNLASYSEDMSSSIYRKSNVTFTGQTTTAPDGNEVEFITVDSYIYLNIAAIGGTAPTTTRTFSFYVKAQSAGYQINYRRPDGFGILTDVSHTEWTRIEATSLNTSNNIMLTDNRSIQSVGNVAFWGVQFENKSYATSYIPTNGTSVTRITEFCNKTSIPSLIGQTEGAFFLDFVYTGLYDNSLSFLTRLAEDNTNTNRIGIYSIRSSDALRTFCNSNNVGQFDAQIGTLVVGQRYKVAMRYKINDFSIYLNGTNVYTNTSANVPLVLNDYVLGNIPNTILHSYYCKTNQATLFKEALTDTELETLTT